MREKMQQEFKRRRDHSLIPALSPGTVVTLKDSSFLKGQLRPSHMPKYDGQRYVIVRQTQLGTYVVRDMQGNVLDRRIPIDQMKLVRGWRASDVHEGDVYEVERLLDHHKDSAGITHYLVKWKGYDTPAWEPQHNILDTSLIANYHKYRKKFPHRRAHNWIPFETTNESQSQS
jgi:hypothetical protein